MPSFNGLPAVRDDFRCSLCRHKHAFHCEHDTPYRDQLLGSYDAERPEVAPTTSRRDSQRTRASNNTSSHSKKRNKATTNSIRANSPTHHEAPAQSTDFESAREPQRSSRRQDDYSAPNTHRNNSIKEHEQKKKKGGCIIL